jgi:phosphotransferase system enzyme I (PtsP)
MSGTASSAIRIHVHERGDRRIDGILRLIDEAGRARPLGETLNTLVAEIAIITASDVVSVYLRETGADGELLVMRANVGFPHAAVGRVRLRVGQGITGFVAECLRPVSVAIAPEDERFAPVEGLGEEKFPSFLAVPIFASGGAEGVLVMQRRAAEAFGATEVALAAALATPFGYAIDRSRARLGDSASSRSARLLGHGISGGAALGRALFLAPFDAIKESRARLDVAHAFELIEKSVTRARRRLRGLLSSRDDAELASVSLIFMDERLRRLARAECDRLGVVDGLRAVASTYAHACASDAEEHGLREVRAVELEDLCLLAAAAATGTTMPMKQSIVIVPERLSALVVLTAIAQRASAIVVGSHVDPTSLPVRLARAAELPIAGDVAGLYAWLRDGDRVLVDGDRGTVRINPRVTAIAKSRRR